MRDRFIELLAARVDTAATVVVEQSYPNLGLVDPTRGRAVVVSHGHFVEPLYRMMSLLDDVFVGAGRASGPQHLEADNGGWIDFFWSSMGDSGDIGTWARTSTNRSRARSRSRPSPRACGMRWPGGRAHGSATTWRARSSPASSNIRSRGPCGGSGTIPTCSRRTAAGLLGYLDGPVAAQLADEAGAPADVTFVFGHTHKPFSDVRVPPVSAAPVTIVNTGGWVVDSPEPEPVKGAVVVLIDEDLNVASLHCYAQHVEGAHADVAVRVEGVAGVPDNPLVQEMRQRIDPDRDPWRALAEATAATVRERRRQLELRLADERAELARTEHGGWRTGGQSRPRAPIAATASHEADGGPLPAPHPAHTGKGET